MKTADVKKIVIEVLATLPKPYSENIVDEVFFAIEQNDRLFRIYSQCVNDLGRAAVNNAGANCIKKELGLAVLSEIPAVLSKLIETYPVLGEKTATKVKKPAVAKIKKPAVVKVKTITATARKRMALDARKSLSEYYMANKASLSPQIGLYREQIIKLITSGVPVADAFKQAVAQEAADLFN